MRFRAKYPDAKLGDQPVPGLYLTDRWLLCGGGQCPVITTWRTEFNDSPGQPVCSDECMAVYYPEGYLIQDLVQLPECPAFVEVAPEVLALGSVAVAAARPASVLLAGGAVLLL